MRKNNHNSVFKLKTWLKVHNSRVHHLTVIGDGSVGFLITPRIVVETNDPHVRLNKRDNPLVRTAKCARALHNWIKGNQNNNRGISGIRAGSPSPRGTEEDRCRFCSRRNNNYLPWRIPGKIQRRRDDSIYPAQIGPKSPINQGNRIISLFSAIQEDRISFSSLHLRRWLRIRTYRSPSEKEKENLKYRSTTRIQYKITRYHGWYWRLPSMGGSDLL